MNRHCPDAPMISVAMSNTPEINVTPVVYEKLDQCAPKPEKMSFLSNNLMARKFVSNPDLTLVPHG